MKEELKMFLLLKEMGGGEASKGAALLTNPLFPCRVQYFRERENRSVFTDLPAASSLRETNKNTARETERGKPHFFCCTHN